MENDARIQQLERQIRGLRRFVFGLSLCAVAVACIAAQMSSDPPQAVKAKLSIIDNNGTPKIVLNQNGDADIQGKLTVKGPLLLDGKDISKVLQQAPGRPPAPAAVPILKVGETRIIIVAPAAPAGPQDYMLQGPNVQDFIKDVGHRVVACWPVIRDHHADYPGYARWWKEWKGYFGVYVKGDKICWFGGPQDNGRWVVDVIYLYTD
jgi:hypothetical protein